MRNISFMLTTQQVRDRLKWVTRRMGWKNLKVGEILQACEKCQGLGKGGKLVKLCKIKVKSVRTEQLSRMTKDIFYGADEVIAEGFPDMTPGAFVDFFCKSHAGCKPDSLVTRIEFEYVYEGRDTLAEAATMAKTLIEARNEIT